MVAHTLRTGQQFLALADLGNTEAGAARPASTT
jgi:hypothetical protein